MERIKELARQLAERFGTADPFALCAALDITVLPVGLPPGVRGFYGCAHGACILYLNGALEENERRTVCAHELGHALLHEGHNALFLRERTDFVMERYEREADLFAGYLLLDGETVEECLRNGWTSEQAAAFTGLPAHIVEYCMTH